MKPKVQVVITRKLRIPFTWRNRFKDSKKKSKESKKKLKEAKQKKEIKRLEKLDHVKKTQNIKKINGENDNFDTGRGDVINKQPKLKNNQKKIKEKREKQSQSKTIKPKKKGGKGKATPTLSALTKVINLFLYIIENFMKLLCYTL